MRGLVTAAVLGDPLPGRLARAEALRLSLPAPRPEQDLAQWLSASRDPHLNVVAGQSAPKQRFDAALFE